MLFERDFMLIIQLFLNKIFKNIKIQRYYNKMFTQYKYQQVKDFYSEDNSSRYEQLIKKFEQVYNLRPNFIARSPGRVNIIGEHIDYQGYGVFPCAIEKDCLIAVRINKSNKLEIYNVDDKKYPKFQTSNDFDHFQQYPNRYISYVIAGYRAAIQKMNPNEFVGMQLMVSGNVPIASGVSSSSALVVCSATASYYANKQNGKRQVSDFIEACIRRQRQCGLAGGGMDQTISVMAKAQSCFYIQFNPIRCQKVDVPLGCKLIVMNSLVQNQKVDSAIFRYNKRVVQCRLGIYLMAKHLQIKKQIYQKWKILRQLQQYLNLSINITSSLVYKSILRKQYSKKDIQEELGQNIWDLLSDIQLSSQVILKNDKFNLFEAVKHVFQQSQRVLDLIDICKSNLNDRQKNIFFGKLMNESHYSCSKLYNCSCQQLDQLTQLALKYGALGSRLTGAGWGGCTVSLVEDSNVHDFIENMKNSYYKRQPFKQRSEKIGLQNVIFQSKPAQGSSIILLD